MEKLTAIRLMLIEPWTFTSFKWGNRRLKKWMKKNAKSTIEDKYPFEQRQEYIWKKFRTYTRRRGIIIKTQDRDYLPRGAFIAVPNFTNNLAFGTLTTAFGGDRGVVFALPKGEWEKKYQGFAKASNSFFIDYSNEEKAMASLNAATTYAKNFNRILVLFPEQTPHKELGEFNPYVFRLAQKYFLPIVPTTIKNLNDVNYRDLELTKVKVVFHTVMKPMKMMNLKPELIAQKVRAIISKELSKK